MFFRIFITGLIAITSLSGCATKHNPNLFDQKDTTNLKAYQSEINHSKNYVYRPSKLILLNENKGDQ
ncbi:hypothetical protein L3V86_08410 [Thiotrichales bacterium 19S11-10]|nr:hypothetical protein [Thiotrichales bacterium 19S11-10]